MFSLWFLILAYKDSRTEAWGVFQLENYEQSSSYDGCCFGREGMGSMYNK